MLASGASFLRFSGAGDEDLGAPCGGVGCDLHGDTIDFVEVLGGEDLFW